MEELYLNTIRITMTACFKDDSVKTDRYRYTEWRDKKDKVYALMLYDHSVDLVENINISERPRNKGLVEILSKMLQGLRK